jgi:hypothetical protein
MLTNVDSLGAKTSQNEPHNYFCEKCDYTTCKLGNWKRHLNTKKHNVDYMLTNVDSLGAKTSQNEPQWGCKCGKYYSYKQSYYRHKKTCTYKPPVVETETENQIVAKDIDKDEIIMELLKKMSEQQQQLNEQNKVIGDLVHRVGNHNNVNTNSFNTNIILQLNSNYPNAQPVQYLIDQIKNNPKCITHDPKMYAQALVEALSNQPDDHRTVRAVKDTMYVKYEETFKEDKAAEVFDTIKKETEQDQLSKAADQNKNMFQREKEAKEYAEMVSGIMKPLTSKDKKLMKNKLIKTVGNDEVTS